MSPQSQNYVFMRKDNFKHQFLKNDIIITKIRTIFLFHTNLWPNIFEFSNRLIHLQQKIKVIVLTMY